VLKKGVEELEKHMEIPIFNMAVSISNTADLVSPLLVDHHKRVGYIANALAVEMGLPIKEQNEIMLAGLLHDMGGISLQERENALTFEDKEAQFHSIQGYLLFKDFQPFSKIADLIYYHHTWWEKSQAKVPLGSHIIHLADRVAVSYNKNIPILEQRESIVKKISLQSGRMFMPEIVEAFSTLAQKEYFWFDIVSQYYILPILAQKDDLQNLKIDLDDLQVIAKIFSKIIDFRSSFTANHSGGVSATASAIAALMGFSDKEQQLMKVAGLLHDVGKLAIPPHILEKPGPLTRDEYNIIKSHTFFSYRTLEAIKGFETINQWASYHHERLDGQGYPFHLAEKSLPIGSKVMAVADVFTAITEDRPYRKSMDKKRVVKILTEMAQDKALDKEMVDIVITHYDHIDEIRRQAQLGSGEEYLNYQKEKDISSDKIALNN
jgi:HD-GYP domain-containing protein (c-di-GMP phosphodiesterase class II)